MRKKYRQGIFVPNNQDKFIGTKATYRSGLELKFFRFCDKNPNVLQWGSENIVVPYKSPLDNRHHKYYVDNFVVIKEGDEVKRYLVEIKPKNQVTPPKKNPNRKTKSWHYAIREWGKNQAKWKSATHYCQKHNMEFKVLTENDLGLNNPYK